MANEIGAPRSKVIESFEWLSERIPYPEKDVKGDTFPITWADDGEMYTSAGDPLWGDKRDGLDVEKFSGMAPDYKIQKVNSMPGYYGWGGDGPKPSGMICVKGVLYLAFQNLLAKKPPLYGTACQHGSDAQIVASYDHGLTWKPGIRELTAPMFKGPLFGGPAFVNFGKNNENARDPFVYAASADQWDNGCHLRLGRVFAEQIMRPECWQWVCGFLGSGEPIWSEQLEKAVSLLTVERRFSIPELVYLAGIKRYLLLTWWLKADFHYKGGSGLLVFEAPEPWGPFSFVQMEDPWDTVRACPYCPRIPLKWMEADGVTGWLQSSGSWNWPPSPNPEDAMLYRSHVRKFRLKMR